MKKIKWILLAITLALAGLFLFATCRKTNAYNLSLDEPIITNDYNLGQDQGFAFILSPTATNVYYLRLDLNNNYQYYLDYGNQSLRFRANNGVVIGSLPIQNYTGLIYIQLCANYVDQELYIFLDYIDYTVINRQDESPLLTDFSVDYSSGLYIRLSLLESNYFSSQVDIQYSIDYNGTFLYQGFVYQCQFDISSNFSQEPDEQVEQLFDEIKVNIPKKIYNDLIDTYYTNGYNAGYQLGYNRGYGEGYSLGEREGYNDGYQAGQEDTNLYQNGYNAGYTAGYSDGEMSTDAYSLGYDTGYDEGLQIGYRNGYQSGYLYGYEQGQAGENAITPAFSVISSVFGVVASVMSIQLFPGITIGLLILVPLFFAVLGLILWIWRRN